MFSVGDVEDIRWLVHVISFEEWSEGRENKSSGWEKMGGSQDSRHKARVAWKSSSYGMNPRENLGHARQ